LLAAGVHLQFPLCLAFLSFSPLSETNEIKHRIQGEVLFISAIQFSVERGHRCFPSTLIMHLFVSDFA